VRLHIAASVRLIELADEVEALRRAGKIREAKRLYETMEQIATRLRQLEEAVRPQGP
jgi:hypothetical protein